MAWPSRTTCWRWGRGARRRRRGWLPGRGGALYQRGGGGAWWGAPRVDHLRWRRERTLSRSLPPPRTPLTPLPACAGAPPDAAGAGSSPAGGGGGAATSGAAARVVRAARSRDGCAGACALLAPLLGAVAGPTHPPTTNQPTRIHPPHRTQVAETGGGTLVLLAAAADGSVCRLRLQVPTQPGTLPEQVQVGGGGGGGWEGGLCTHTPYVNHHPPARSDSLPACLPLAPSCAHPGRSPHTHTPSTTPIATTPPPPPPPPPPSPPPPPQHTHSCKAKTLTAPCCCRGWMVLPAARQRSQAWTLTQVLGLEGWGRGSKWVPTTR